MKRQFAMRVSLTLKEALIHSQAIPLSAKQSRIPDTSTTLLDRHVASLLAMTIYRSALKVNGRIALPMEVGAGFVPDFTERENVYLNGSILGMSKKEIDRKLDEIVDFAEMSASIPPLVKSTS